MAAGEQIGERKVAKDGSKVYIPDLGSAKLTGGAPGLQTRCGALKGVPGGFDSHALPPSIYSGSQPRLLRESGGFSFHVRPASEFLFPLRHRNISLPLLHFLLNVSASITADYSQIKTVKCHAPDISP